MIILLVLMTHSVLTSAEYFNTNRHQKMIGFLLDQPEQIEEVAEFGNSNSFAADVQSLNEITKYLDSNTKQLLPVIVLDDLLFDPDSGMYRSDNVALIIQAVLQSKRQQKEILFLMDEPLWTVRRACQEGKYDACEDMENSYVETLSTLRAVGKFLRQYLPGSGMIHIEAYAELVAQKREHPDDNVIMLDDAEYLGFNCYGKFHSCGDMEYGYRSQIEYGAWVWDTMNVLESVDPIGRKLLLVAGTFVAKDYFDDIQDVIEQLASYLAILSIAESRVADRVGGIGFFLWGERIVGNTLFLGARYLLCRSQFNSAEIHDCTISPTGNNSGS
jgi:hypothetical protein